MLDEGKINSRQAGFLMFTFMMGSATLIVSASSASTAKQDGWISLLLATLFGLGIVLLYTKLGLMFPKQSLVQYSELVLGKWIGKTIGLLYIWYFFYLSALVTGLFRDYVITVALPDTPKAVISGSILAVIAYGIRGGIESLGRVNEAILPVRELVVFLVITFALMDSKWENLTPVMGVGGSQILKSALTVTAFPFAETILFAMLVPNIKDIKKVKKSFIMAILAGGMMLVLTVLVSMLVLGPAISSRLTFPTHMVIGYINLGDFVSNLDSLGMLIWVSSGFMKIAICYYCTVVGIAQWCRLSDYRPLVTPVGILMFIFSIIAYTLIEDMSLAVTTWPFYSAPFVILFPLLMLAVAKIRRLDEGKIGK